jgi:2-polyprenyl-3-methyl-5-hydroxy-6-metoxy-1,4-benzoquinol methylase
MNSENERSLFSQASDPKQYDADSLDWEKEGSADSPTRVLFRHYILADKENIKDKDVLDIGSGTGWLLEDIQKAGARSVTGIEPSEKNVAIAQRKHPKVTTILASWEDFKSDQQYDLIVSVMVTPHIADMDAAMEKMATLVKLGGEIRLIVPNYDYFSKPRFNYELKVEPINDNEYVVSTKRKHGVMVDIVRKVSVFKDAASKTGLTMIEEVGVKPTPEFLKLEPRYEEFKDVAIADLLKFQAQLHNDN